MTAGAAFGAPDRPHFDAVWVTTRLDVDRRSYVVVLSPHHDLERARPEDVRELTAAGALQWASACLAAAAAAEHDGVVLRQLRALGVQPDGIVDTMRHLRADRAEAHPLPATAGYAVRGGTTTHGVGFLILSVDGHDVAQWTVQQARQHALGVLETTAAADLDSAYFRTLVDHVGVDVARASQVVHGLMAHRTPPAATKRKGKRR